MKTFQDRWEKVYDVKEDFPAFAPRKMQTGQCSFWIFKQVMDNGVVLWAGTLKYRERGQYVKLLPSIDLSEVIFNGIAKMHAHYGSTQ